MPTRILKNEDYVKTITRIVIATTNKVNKVNV